MAITTPTVFILGAGVSQEYQFPLGYELISRVLTHKPAQVEDPKQEIHFKETLKTNACNSVDEFLENNPDFIEIGKKYIADVLLFFENDNNLFPPTARERNFYYLLANLLELGKIDLGENKLTILTFNYERSLEQYLLRVIKSRRRLTDNNAALEELNRLPIIHLHGSLGSFSNLVNSGREYGVRYDGDVQEAAKSIRIISESETVFPEYKTLSDIFQAAENVYILGFGYHRLNVERLLNSGLHAKLEDNGSPRIKACRRGIDDKRWSRIVSELFRGKINGRQSQATAAAFLENEYS